MAISTYAELQTAVTNWLHRSDLSSYVADFISLGEARIGREVRAQIQEQRTTASLSASSAYINLPSDYIEERAIWLQTSPKKKIEYLAPEAFFERYPDSDACVGQPVAYTIIGDEVRFAPFPDSAYTVELWYLKKLTALSSAVNTLFTNNPDLYLYASLLASAPFLKDDKRIGVWESIFEQTKASVNAVENRKRYPTGMAISVV